MLGHSIRTPQFIVAAVVLENVLSITLPLSKALQSVTIDLIHALSIIKCAHNLLMQKRHESEESFTEIWQQATKLSRQLMHCLYAVLIFFPNIRTLLLITATLPVTTATPERTFSSLRLLKSYLRTTMGPNRLAGLTLLYLHRDIPITLDEVIDTFARHSSRRLEFVLQ